MQFRFLNKAIEYEFKDSLNVYLSLGWRLWGTERLTNSILNRYRKAFAIDSGG